MGRTNSVVVGLASALVLIAGLASAEMLDQDSMSINETSRQMCADQSPFMVAAAEGKQVPTGEVEERAVPGAPVFPGSSPGRPDLIVASLEKDLDLLEQEVRSAQARLAQPGSNAQEVASASFPKFDALTRSIAGKAATLQQHYSQINDQRRRGAATSLKATADQMTQMVATSATQSRSVSNGAYNRMLTMLSNLANMRHEMLKAVANNLRG